MKAFSSRIQSLVIACIWTLAMNRPAPLVAADSNDLFYVETLRHGEPTKFQAAGSPIHFEQPGGIAVDRFGNVYVAETDREMGFGNVIRKIARGGIVTSFAGVQGSYGSKDGPSDSALFFVPEGLTVDEFGNVYVADSHNHSVRKISAGMVTTLSSVFSNPLGVAADRHGNVYVADTRNQVIRRIPPEGDPQIIAGSFGSAGSSDGFRTAARFDNPGGLAFDEAGNLYVADSGNHSIRKITTSGVVTTVAGAARVAGSTDGAALEARFWRPSALAVDRFGNIFVSDSFNNTIRRITPVGMVTTVAGQARAVGDVDGIGSVARFYFPVGVAVDAAGAVYIADMGNSRVRVLVPISAPVIETQPSSQTIGKGSTVVFTAKAAASPLPTYQWQKDGQIVAGATDSTLVITAATEANAGAYTCVVTNSSGTVTSSAATLTVATPSQASRLMNLSVRANTGTEGQPLIVGFVVGGSGTSGSGSVLIRAAGPALSALGVSNVLADPRLTVFQGGTVIASNDNWATPVSNELAVQAAESATGAFPFSSLSGLDAALVTELPPTSAGYTAWINGAATGTTLAELYDRTPAYSATTPRLINVSARAHVGPSPDILIAGFVIGGTTAKTVLIRAIGPGLEQFGIDTALQHPQMALHTTLNGEDVTLATNAGWDGRAEISTIGNAVGAFPIASTTSADAAIARSLSPGAYTIHITDKFGDAGSVLVEIYEVP
jgi:hypothetical protein